LKLGSLAVLGFSAFCPPAHADPLLLETGVALGPLWLVLGVGLAVEAAILAAFIRRPVFEAVAVSVPANVVTGFIGFVALMYARLRGIPALPVGPTLLAAIPIEALLISLMLRHPPVNKVIAGVVVANLFTACLALAVLATKTIQSGTPEAGDDLALARSIRTVRTAIDTYHDRFGYYPASLSGGSSDQPASLTDPLIASGILESYPANPFAPYLRCLRFNWEFLLTGIGPATSQVSLDNPTDQWEARWFPIIKKDPRFGATEKRILCANGICEQFDFKTLTLTKYTMNGNDYIPGCFFYKAYDFNNDGLADDYILGVFGWPGGSGTSEIDLIDRRTGNISLALDSQGRIGPGQSDGVPEPVLALYAGGADAPQPEN
jgi:type II secretory pathway pseudopilin PulG